MCCCTISVARVLNAWAHTTDTDVVKECYRATTKRRLAQLSRLFWHAGCEKLHLHHDVASDSLNVQAPTDEPLSAVDLAQLTNITSQMVSLSS